MPISDAKAYAVGEVVIVPFPFTDRLAEKRRPALVVSGKRLNHAGLIWVIMITSSKRTDLPGDTPILNRSTAGLDVDCLVRPAKIASMEAVRIVRRIGKLDNPELRKIMKTVRSFFDA